jgi:hypothetical protein
VRFLSLIFFVSRLDLADTSLAPRGSSEFPDLKMVNQQVYQYCIYPRLLLSLEDAAFCAKFIKMMHTMGTQNFASLWYHDHYTFTEWTAPLLASMTENEARNYGRSC